MTPERLAEIKEVFQRDSTEWDSGFIRSCGFELIGALEHCRTSHANLHADWLEKKTRLAALEPDLACAHCHDAIKVTEDFVQVDIPDRPMLSFCCVKCLWNWSRTQAECIADWQKITRWLDRPRKYEIG